MAPATWNLPYTRGEDQTRTAELADEAIVQSRRRPVPPRGKAHGKNANTFCQIATEQKPTANARTPYSRCNALRYPVPPLVEASSGDENRFLGSPRLWRSYGLPRG